MDAGNSTLLTIRLLCYVRPLTNLAWGLVVMVMVVMSFYPRRGQNSVYTWQIPCVPEHLPSVLLPILIGSQIARQSCSPSYMDVDG